MTNLVNNSLVHAFEQRDHGQILIRAEALQEDFVRLTVSDDGVGITAELQERIFEPFFTTKMGRGGTGLGLHIVHNLVTHVLGGTITLESTPGTGAAASCCRFRCRRQIEPIRTKNNYASNCFSRKNKR